MLVNAKNVLIEGNKYLDGKCKREHALIFGDALSATMHPTLLGKDDKLGFMVSIEMNHSSPDVRLLFWDLDKATEFYDNFVNAFVSDAKIYEFDALEVGGI